MKKQEKSNEHIQFSEAMKQQFIQHHKTQTEKIVRLAFEQNRQAILIGLRRYLTELSTQQQGASENLMSDADWIQVESMSRLRGLVGGRFQNLKSRWTEAGFPLKEHRGDTKVAPPKINQEGWLELVAWIGKQGFEARLPSGESTWLFEIRRVS